MSYIGKRRARLNIYCKLFSSITHPVQTGSPSRHLFTVNTIRLAMQGDLYLDGLLLKKDAQ
jgi:hypothetical protein